jgi:hypothetical protein
MATPRKTAAAKKTTAARSATARSRKAPADHKAPEAEQQKDFVEVTLRGATWRVDREVLDDFELLDDLNALDQRDDPTRMPSVLRRFLGDAQFAKAMDACRNDKGRVTIEAGSEFVWDLMRELNPNSPRS